MSVRAVAALVSVSLYLVPISAGADTQAPQKPEKKDKQVRVVHLGARLVLQNAGGVDDGKFKVSGGAGLRGSILRAGKTSYVLVESEGYLAPIGQALSGSGSAIMSLGLKTPGACGVFLGLNAGGKIEIQHIRGGGPVAANVKPWMTGLEAGGACAFESLIVQAGGRYTGELSVADTRMQEEDNVGISRTAAGFLRVGAKHAGTGTDLDFGQGLFMLEMGQTRIRDAKDDFLKVSLDNKFGPVAFGVFGATRRIKPEMAVGGGEPRTDTVIGVQAGGAL